jgi:hypothetical protein
MPPSDMASSNQSLTNRSDDREQNEYQEKEVGSEGLVSNKGAGFHIGKARAECKSISLPLVMHLDFWLKLLEK